MAIKTVEDLSDYMKIHGNTRLGDFELNDQLINCVKELNELEFNPTKEIELHYITKSRMKKNAKEFLKNNPEIAQKIEEQIKSL